MEMVRHTRLDAAVVSAGMMRHGAVEAMHHARHRRAFGRLLVDQPVMKAVLADLVIEAEAALVLVMRVASAFDGGSAGEAALSRIGAAVAKFWVTKRLPNHAYEALECLGGNGYVEEGPLARFYREAPVNAIWEGSGNVNALDVLRALAREPRPARLPDGGPPRPGTPPSTAWSSASTATAPTSLRPSRWRGAWSRTWRWRSRPRCCCASPRRRSHRPSSPRARGRDARLQRRAAGGPRPRRRSSSGRASRFEVDPRLAPGPATLAERATSTAIGPKAACRSPRRSHSATRGMPMPSSGVWKMMNVASCRCATADQRVVEHHFGDAAVRQAPHEARAADIGGVDLQAEPGRQQHAERRQDAQEAALLVGGLQDQHGEGDVRPVIGRDALNQRALLLLRAGRRVAADLPVAMVPLTAPWPRRRRSRQGRAAAPARPGSTSVATVPRGAGWS